ncbi:MAG: hypothetical protein B7Z10_07740 [Rhodobacterales bacterium 32-66-7]|nr:MAG: hypothetical protein B7Z31_04035 [Rhodobacterales bacterium 12-65-15]OYX24965.1 MAG: hypothetical protein B7Z10_07740 [Rhodobacterales bacterium 32-66-7]
MSRKAVEAALLEDQRRFLGFLVSRLRNVDDAMDVMQDFAARALARAEDLRDVASLRGWLSRILATTLADHQRKSSRRRQREMSAEVESETLDTTAEPDREIDAAICECIGDMIRHLPPGQADLVRRIDLQEEGRAAVAVSLGISLGTLAVRLHRARTRLRDLLMQMCLTCPDHGFLDCECARARKRAAETSPASVKV